MQGRIWRDWISDEDAASLMPEADDEELDVVIDAAIDRVLSSMA